MVIRSRAGTTFKMGAGCSGGYDLPIQGYGDVPNFKIVLVGDPEVGKSSVFMRYFKNQFDYSYRTSTSVSIENVVKKVNVPEHLVVSVTIWDLPGSEEVDLRKSYYQDVDAAIVVVNVADKESVELAGTWRQDIHNHAVVSSKRIEQNGKVSKVIVEYEKADPTRLPVLLLGNKYDIVEEREALRENTEAETETSETSDNPATEKNDSDRAPLIINKEKPAKEKSVKENSSQEEKKDLEKEYIGTEEGRDVTVWKYEDEHEQEVELPEEVEFLEQVAEQQGFVGSVAVSAKNSDGGVHTAIQALVRHLLERKLKDKAIQKMEAIEVRRHKRKKRSKVKRSNPDDFQPLEKTDVEELDKFFMQSNFSLNRIHEMGLAYNQALKQFKKECLHGGIVVGPKSSVEDCIGGLKAALAEQNLELLTRDEAGFLEFVVQGGIIFEEEKSANIKKIMDTFQTEVVVACQAVLKDTPTADADLIRMDAKITDRCQDLWTLAEKAGPLTLREKKRVQDRVDYNRARIRQAHLQGMQVLQDVDGLYKKIKAAMLW